MTKGLINRLTREEQARLKLLAVHSISFELSENDALAYIAMLAPDLGPKVDKPMLRRYRARVRQDEFYTEWLKWFSNKGYVRMYKDRIDEMEAIQARLKRKFLQELLLPESKEELELWKARNPNALNVPRLQNTGYLIGLAAQITGINKRLSQLQNSGPTAHLVSMIARYHDPETPEEERRAIGEKLKMVVTGGA